VSQVIAAARGIDQHPSPDQPAPGETPQGLAFTHPDGKPPRLMVAVRATESRHGRRTDHPIGRQAHVALELLDRRTGEAAEKTVLRPGVEAEPIQPVLHVADVVATHQS